MHCFTRVAKCAKDKKHNTLYFTRKYTRIFVLGLYMFFEAHFFLTINLLHSLNFAPERFWTRTWISMEILIINSKSKRWNEKNWFPIFSFLSSFILHSPFSFPYSPFQILHSSVSSSHFYFHSPFTIHHSPIHHSPFAIRHSPSSIPHPPFSLLVTSFLHMRNTFSYKLRCYSWISNPKKSRNNAHEKIQYFFTCV